MQTAQVKAKQTQTRVREDFIDDRTDRHARTLASSFSFLTQVREFRHTFRRVPELSHDGGLHNALEESLESCPLSAAA